jgi:predicted kinase
VSDIPTSLSSNPDQVRNSLKIAESELQLWEYKVTAYTERQTKERGFIAALAREVLQHEGSERVIQEYLRAHKSHSDAELNLMQVQIAKLKGQAAILQAHLDEMKKPAPGDLIAPPKGRLVVPGVR